MSTSRLCLFLLVSLFAAATRAAELRLTIDNIAESAGRIMVAIVASEAAFAGDEPAAAQLILPASAPELIFTTTALPPGSYAVRVMHDKNGNGELDTNLVGMPTEPWGFSNSASGNFGPPKWEDARFELNDSTAQRVTLNR